MRVTELTARSDMSCLCLSNDEREITGVYIGDLLSWVMGRAPADSAWITIMSNANVAAVAALADVACVILAEDVKPDPQLLKAAKERGITLFSSQLTAYELSVRLAEGLKNE